MEEWIARSAVAALAAAVLLASAPAAADSVRALPLPAEPMPRAAQSSLMGLAQAGDALIAVGDRGDILRSTDGSTWTQMPAPVRSPLTAAAFADAHDGWAVGHDGVILHTTDGGLHWSLQHWQPVPEKPLLGLLALDAQRAFAVGAFGLFYRTADGGAHWEEVSAPALRGKELHLYTIRLLGNGGLLVAGEQGTLGISADGGASWRALASPYDGTWFDAVPVGDRGALLCGLRGNAYLAQDAAAGPWIRIETGTTDSLFGCRAIGSGKIALAGLNGTAMLLDTTTGKVSALASPDAAAYSDVLPLREDLVMVGEDGIAHIRLPQ
jgi:photosystem II stability/assembly factor-like uncharacterized protein